MTRILVIKNVAQILAWLVGESAESAELHIKNGYPELLPAWEAGEVTAVEVEVSAGDEYHPERFEVTPEGIRRRSA
ncbi:MAG TPA: hypothetical protein DCP69_08070 [Candidatus Omnitrophica bacterium]|nr:hypothetical protein [Candidatus Omnitrophota bacterium]